MKVGNQTRGFTLVEIMVVVVIIGILAALSMPLFRSIYSSSKASAFANDIKIFSQAMKFYALENGDYPPDSGPGSAPAEFVPYLPTGFMERETPIGGEWDIDVRAGAGVTAAVGVANLDDIDLNLITQIDETIDDGNLGTGSFQLISMSGGRAYWIVEE